MGEARVGGCRPMLEGLVMAGYLTRQAADEVALVIEELTELTELGALSIEQGEAIVEQLAREKALEYREMQEEERASA